MNQEMVPYEVACRAIGEAKSIDDAMQIADRAEALRVYARRAKNRALEIDCVEIRIRAERRLGEMLVGMKESGLMAKGGRPPGHPAPSKITLQNIGVPKKLSSSAQQLARQEMSNFERQLTNWRANLIFEDRKASVSRPRLCAPEKEPDFRLSDGIPVGNVRFGKLRSRIDACLREARLLAAIMEHAQGADALAKVDDVVSQRTLKRLIAASEVGA